jgi:hypothetical protein
VICDICHQVASIGRRCGRGSDYPHHGRGCGGTDGRGVASFIYPEPAPGEISAAILLGTVGGVAAGLIMKPDITTRLNLVTVAVCLHGDPVTLFLWNAIF